ncbi:MAG TPA: D-aminoacyl-tRNA deacylase [Polyangiales bacterium]|nr:D-aminoacyl-tRNA deacylase [Polyangiales bacterium]
MRAVAQRVREARVEVSGACVGAIDFGLLVYLGVGKGDGPSEVRWMADKLAGLRIFEDEAGKLARSVSDARGQVLVVSQFTLYGDIRKGRRPSFDRAAPPELAEQLYLEVCGELRTRGLTVATGQFRSTMQVHACVDGPVTLVLDHEKSF